MNDETHAPDSWTDYRAAVTRFIAAVEQVLAQGHAAQARYDLFCARHGIRPGSGAEQLVAETVPLAERHVHQRLLGLTETLYATFLGPVPEKRPTLARVATRGLRNRHRI